MDREQVNVWKTEPLLDQPDDLVQQLVLVQDRGDGTAHLVHCLELDCPAAQVLVEQGVIDRDSNASRKRTQHQQVHLVEISGLVAMHIEHSEQPVARDQWQGEPCSWTLSRG